MAITSVSPIENRMIAVLYCVYTRTGGHVWWSDPQCPVGACWFRFERQHKDVFWSSYWVQSFGSDYM